MHVVHIYNDIACLMQIMNVCTAENDVDCTAALIILHSPLVQLKQIWLHAI